MMPKINVNRIAIFLVAIFAGFLILSVLKLAATSSKNLQEVNTLKTTLAEKNIELESIKEQLRVEIYMNKVSLETIAKLQKNENDFNIKLKSQKTAADKKAPIFNKRIETAKAKVVKAAQDVNPDSIELTLDTIIKEAGIKDSAEVQEYIQTQIAESTSVIEEINSVLCLMEQSELELLGKDTNPCALSTF